MISAENVHSVFRYDANSGKLFWKINRGSAIKAGMEAGSMRFEQGVISYIQVVHMKRWYFAHRIIWLMEYGEWPDNIDHINGNGIDNRLENLRNVSNGENQKNKRVYKSSRTNISGVQPRGNKWLSNICVNSKMIHLGVFSDFFEACCYRKSAENKYGFHPNHGRN